MHEMMSLDGVLHTIGGSKCIDCWDSYPVACVVKGCAGLVHSSFVDENHNGDYRCDVCGYTGDPHHA